LKAEADVWMMLFGMAEGLDTGGAEVLGFQKQDRTLGGKAVAARFHAGVLDIL
jgi:hypothetical protein